MHPLQEPPSHPQWHPHFVLHCLVQMRALSFYHAATWKQHDKKTVLAFAQDSAEQSEDATADEMGAPAADAYKSKSGSIIEVLEDMRAKAAGQLQKLQGEETKAKHEFQ